MTADATLDLSALTDWLDSNEVPGSGEPVTTRALTGGTTNVVFHLSRGGHEFVLRMSPTGMSTRAGTTMLREYTVLRALHGTDVPCARAWALCPDPAVLGSPFYVMDYIEGWSPAASDDWPAPFDVDPSARRGLATELIEAIARLSRVDWQSRGLADFGHPEDFHDRQVDRWLAQFADVRFRALPGLEEAATWLRANRPRDWSPGIMHGDYQFANVMFAHGAPARLVAIIDWELSTIGDPLLDLAWVLMSADWNAAKFDLSGLPSHAELIEQYRRSSGRSVADIDYYLILARFKMAVILEGGYARSRNDPRHARSAGFGAISLDLAARAGAMAVSYG